ncbi:MAG: hypothetical protein J6N21_02940 [Butyrivibrio sp.]|nr:hypothetical protein [Butyrivibrio sp.]
MSIYSRTIDLQNLQRAWERVRKNKPAAGVDNITYDQFSENSKKELKALNKELANHEYQSLPVKLVNLYKGEKVRTIALYTMRDKVVQQSLANELTEIFDCKFSDQTFAYRSDKSAIIAVEEISKKIIEEKYSVFLKVDITHFFDSILWDILRSRLEVVVQEDDTLELVKECSCSTSLDEVTGELNEKRCGIYQGSSLAPLLSNVYLLDFDNWLTSIEDIYFARYSDDMVILCNDHNFAMNLLQEIKNKFDALGLKLNDKKSVLGHISEGFDFLGYHFDALGKAIPAKAESNLYERLEMMWLTSGDIGIEDKLKKVLEIVGGWEQYFRGEREVGSIFEIAALVYSNGDSEESRTEILTKRRSVKNIFRDIAEYLANTWRVAKCWDAELCEYEELYNVPERELSLQDNPELKKLMHELLHGYRKFIIREDYDTAIEIMQSYTDLKLYPQGEFWQDKSEQLKVSQDKIFNAMVNLGSSANDVIFKSDTIGKMARLFVGREDLFAKEEVDSNSTRKVIPDLRPLSENFIKEHLMGKLTIDSYVQRPNATVKYLVCDVDICKRVLLQVSRESEEFKRYLQKALDLAQFIKNQFSKMGFPSYIEYSGNRGYHVWLFFTEWIPTRYANMLSEILEGDVETSNDISLEFFPNRTRIKSGKYGQAIKIPYGVHGKTGERSYFIDEVGTPILNVNSALDSFGKVALSEVKKVIATCTKTQEPTQITEVDTDISCFGELESEISEVLLKCGLLRYLCLKSVKTGYLSHFERLTVLYVFGHLGMEGKEFVHKVMSFTLNYKFNVTEDFIRKIPEKPISCVKLRDQYKQLTAEIGCTCNFKRNKNCYPSPVLHAISLSDDLQSDITLPSSKTLTKENESKVKAEMNIYSKAQDIVNKILELKKQKRSIDKTVNRYEKELGDIFDKQGIDELELEVGIMRRRKTDCGVEWIIEI